MPSASEELETEYLNSNDIKKMFDEIRDSYDYIIVDTPPCGIISDALFIAQYSDAAIFVTYQDSVRVSRVKKTIDNLMSTEVRVLGCVLNGTAQGLSGYGYGYGYGYDYGYGYGEDNRKKERKSRKSKNRE